MSTDMNKRNHESQGAGKMVLLGSPLRSSIIYEALRTVGGRLSEMLSSLWNYYIPVERLDVIETR